MILPGQFQLQPDFADAHYGLATVCHERGDDERAIAAFRQVVTLQPGHAAARHMLAALRGDSGSEPPPGFVASLFDAYATGYDDHVTEKLGYQGPGLVEQATTRALDQRGELDALDLGCGTGLFGERIRPRCRHLVGVDLSSEMLSRAGHRGCYDRLVEEDLVTCMVAEADGSYDLITAVDVFNYLSALDAPFEQAARLLRTSGLLAFTVEASGGEEASELGRSGRYRHSRRYLNRLSQAHGLHEVSLTCDILRYEGHSPCLGYTVVLAKRGDRQRTEHRPRFASARTHGTREMGDASADFIADLGRRVEDRWNAAERDEEAFPDLAHEELVRTPPLDHLDVADVIGAFLATDQQATRQLAPVGAFGQPGITLYYGRGFVIDLYCWNNCVPAIHNHPFTGVFTILRGFSLNSTYTFNVAMRLGARLQVGTLQHSGIRLLRQGDMERFSLVEHPLIHSLVHVPNPSISLVVRTVRTLEYFRYFPPAVAMAMSDPDEPTVRQLRLLDFLRAARDPDYQRHMREFLSTADFETTFRAVSTAWEDESLSEWIDIARERHGDVADFILPGVTQAVRLQQDNALREQFESDDDRLVASVLMCSPSRSEVDRLLSEWFHGQSPQVLLTRWVESSGLFSEDPAAADSLRRIINADANCQLEAEERAYWEQTIFRSLI